MSPQLVFLLHLALGYLAALLCFGAYILPWLAKMPRVDAQRVIATVHSFRFFGLVFILPGVVGPHLPPGFPAFAAYGDMATGLLALLALVTFRLRPLFWLFVVLFNVVGAGDILIDYYHASMGGLPEVAGDLGAAYFIPVIYVPFLMITHLVSLYWLLRPGTVAGHPAALTP